eukprot:3294969-Prymnesium_polylepis.1
MSATQNWRPSAPGAPARREALGPCSSALRSVDEPAALGSGGAACSRRSASAMQEMAADEAIGSSPDCSES